MRSIPSEIAAVGQSALRLSLVWLSLLALPHQLHAQDHTPWLAESASWNESGAFDTRGSPIEFTQPGNDLSRLSDDELIQLYTQLYRNSLASDESLRSEVADTAAIVARGGLLLQAGYTFSRNRYDDVTSSIHTVPELLLRYRLLERLELRLAWAGVVMDHLKDEATGTADSDTYLSDPSVGARLALTSQRGWVPRTSLTVASPLNVETPLNLSELVSPFVGLGYSWCVGESWLLAGSSAAVWTRENDSSYLDFQQVVTLDWLGHERWGGFLQWTALLPEGSRLGDINHCLGPGVTYNASARWQYEASVLFGLDEPSPDVLVQLLVSWRL